MAHAENASRDVGKKGHVAIYARKSATRIVNAHLHPAELQSSFIVPVEIGTLL